MPKYRNTRYRTQIKSIPTLKILEMVDDSDVASLYHDIFADSGHKVTLARTVEECLKSIVIDYR